MDENGQDKASSSIISSRHRSPTFCQVEIKALVELLEKHKYAVLNKSTNSAANFAKEKAWAKITKDFNKLGLGWERSVDVLKTKWENLKRSARKITKDVLDNDCDYRNEEINKTVMLICSAENSLNGFDEHKNDDDLDEDSDTEDVKPWNGDEDNDSSFSLDRDKKIHEKVQNKKSKKFRCEMSTGFSPQECKVLLQCVRQEKNVLFTKTSLQKRHEAWERIAKTYNDRSPRKRTSKELSKKFTNMKAMAKNIRTKSICKNYDQLDNKQKIKSEPTLDCSTDFEFDDDDDKIISLPDEFNPSANPNQFFTQDPLNNASNSDSGLGSISDSRDIARLKVELLNYKMETAKLERKRIEDALKADEKEREMRATEHSLRLRTARLEAVAAEAKLPPTHPALNYAAEEKIAQNYLCNLQLDIG